MKDKLRDFNFAMYTMKNDLTPSYFVDFCEQYGINFAPQIAGNKDPLVSQTYVDIHQFLLKKDTNELTIDDLNAAFEYAKQNYDKRVNEMADKIFTAIHNPNKPIVFVNEMDQTSIRLFVDLTRYQEPWEMKSMMNLPVNILGAPEKEDQERLNLAYRIVSNIQRFDATSLMFTTQDATFIHCGNKNIADRLAELEKEYLKARNLPEPQISGRAGVLKAMSEHRGITHPEILQSFVSTSNCHRADALAAVSNIFEEYNKRGMPIYADPQETCFISLDGAFHNYPILMIPGDKIQVRPSWGELASIGDNHSEKIPDELTVVGVHTNEHGSIVITDAGVFALGGIGANIVDQIHKLTPEHQIEYSQFEGPEIHER